MFDFIADENVPQGEMYAFYSPTWKSKSAPEPPKPVMIVDGMEVEAGKTYITDSKTPITVRFEGPMKSQAPVVMCPGDTLSIKGEGGGILRIVEPRPPEVRTQCPKCEHSEVAKDDYLCEECRYGSITSGATN
jgi:hypothetical protein